MANVKISGLPSATTPLAGTEVLPIVQGGVTDQVSVANLTVGRTVNALAFDTDVAAAGVTLSGTTLAADGTDTNINILVNTKGTGGVGINGAPSGTVAGVTVTSNFCVKGDGTNPMAGFVHANNTTASSGSVVYACRSRGTVASPTVVQNNDSLASFVVAGFDGTDLALGASINFEVDGTPGSDDMPTRMVFKTTPDGDQAPAERMRITSLGSIIAGFAVQQKQIAVAASAIDLATGNFFSKTISGTTTFTVSNVPTTGTAASLVLDLTNGGSATVNWWSGVKWAAGTPPTLTASGRDSLGFYTYDGGTTWTGLVLGLNLS